ncbi:hypothetical protein [Humisphaera borealis]|nr:hypothetical protein [Humisphaera borealis]
MIGTLLLSVVAAFAKDVTPKARERADALKADVTNFSLTLRYSGQQDKPYYTVTLTTAPAKESVPFDLHAQLTAAQATKLIDHLAVEGFLDAAIDQRTQDVKAPSGPLYTMTVNGAKHEWVEYLRFDLAMLKRLDAIRAQLDGEPGRAMQFLLDRMSGHRREWEKK